MTRADIARVDAIVIEIFGFQCAGFVTDQAVFRDCRRVPLDLHFHVLGDREQRRTRLVYEHLPRFIQRIDIRGCPIAVLGERLHERIVVIALADAEDRQENAALALPFNKAFEFALVGDADVEITVRRQDHAVDGVFLEA